MNEESKPSKAEVLENAKNRPSTTRANRRAKTMALVKQVTEMLALMEPHKARAVQVLADQLEAMRNVYHNGICVDKVPDEKIRQGASKLLLEWLEGKPRELQVQVSGNVDDFATMLEKFRSSPEAKRLLPELIGSVPPAIEVESGSLQTGPNVVPEIPALNKSG
jgi:hypothetical protein